MREQKSSHEMSRCLNKEQGAVSAAQYSTCIQPFHGHDRIVATSLDNNPQSFIQGRQTLTNEVTDFQIIPIIALTATLTSPTSGIPTKTSPKINNASLTSIYCLQTFLLNVQNFPVNQDSPELTGCRCATLLNYNAQPAPVNIESTVCIYPVYEITHLHRQAPRTSASTDPE